MTLKEKFVEQSIHIRYQVLETDKLEQIADDYAIEFKNWCDKIIIEEWIDKTTEELLEIFKKEKGYDTERKSKRISG